MHSFAFGSKLRFDRPVRRSSRHVNVDGPTGVSSMAVVMRVLCAGPLDDRDVPHVSFVWLTARYTRLHLGNWIIPAALRQRPIKIAISSARDTGQRATTVDVVVPPLHPRVRRIPADRNRGCTWLRPRSPHAREV